MKRTPTLYLILASTIFASFARAQTAANSPASPEEEEAVVELQRFVVDATRDSGYFARNTLAGTRTNERLVNIPQSIQIISSQMIEDLAFANPIEAMKYGSSGITRRSGFAGDIFLRGFRVRNFMKDNVINAGGNTLGSVPMYDIDRIEVIKGPSALLYGQSSATGGLVNFVSKRPTNTAQSSVKVTIGSESLMKGELSSSGPLGGVGLYSVTAGGAETDGPRQRSASSDKFISGSFRHDFSPQTNLSVYYSYYQISEIISAINVDTNGQLVEVPDDFTYYEPWVDYSHYAVFTNASLKSALTPTLQMNLTLSFALEDYNSPWERIVMGATNAATGLTPRTYQSIWASPNRTLDLQLDFVKSFSTGPIKHELSIGGLVVGSKSVSGFDARLLPALDINNPVYNTPKPAIVRSVPVAGQPSPSYGDSYSRQDSGYLQDNITFFNGKILAVGGLRYNQFSSESTNRITNVKTNTRDKALVKRWGVIYKPVDPVSIYYNYSESFSFNSATFIGGPRDGQKLDPSYGINKEVGIKAETPGGLLFGSIAYYDLSLTNVARVYVQPDGTSARDQSAKQTSPGFEVDIGTAFQSPLGSCEVIATYYRGNPKDAVGARPIGTAKSTWSLFGAQTLTEGPLKGLKFGFGVFHKGDLLFASPAPVANYLSPAYTTTTALFSYQRKNYKIALNVDNLGDKFFIDGGENATWIVTNPGRSFKFSFAYLF